MILSFKRSTCSPLGHSADLTLLLHLQDRTVQLHQTGDTAIKLAEDVAIPRGPARLEIINDGVSYVSEIIVFDRKPDSLWLNIEHAN